MSVGPLAKLGEVHGAAAANAAEPPPSPAQVKKQAGIHKAAQDFEAVFVRQLLTAAKFGGDKGSSGYGAMAVDALASGIQTSGGLGLAAAIEKSLATQEASQPRQPFLAVRPAAPASRRAGSDRPSQGRRFITPRPLRCPPVSGNLVPPRSEKGASMNLFKVPSPAGQAFDLQWEP